MARKKLVLSECKQFGVGLVVERRVICDGVCHCNHHLELSDWTSMKDIEKINKLLFEYLDNEKDDKPDEGRWRNCRGRQSWSWKISADSRW